MKLDNMKKTIFIALLSLSLIPCFLSLIYAQEDSLFEYKSSENRDPFIPLVTKDGKLAVTYGTINSIEDVILEGIVYDKDGESVAIINDLVLKENDQIGSIRVKKIERGGVILSFKGEDHTFKLKE